MDIDINELVIKVDCLGLDTKPLLDFQNAVSSGQLIEAPYTQILNTLKNQLLKTYAIRQKPMALQLLLQRLNKKIQQDLTTRPRDYPAVSKTIVNNNIDLDEVQSVIAYESKKGKDLSLEILRELRVMKEDVMDLKSHKNTIVIKEEVQVAGKGVSDSYQPDGVFVNPIDESRVGRLKPKISIKSTVGESNLKDRIMRLKRLKSDS